MQGSVATSGQLPTSGNAQGDAYIVQADDSLWIWDGSAWVSGGSIQGPQGAPGAPGATGPAGQGVAAGGTTGQALVKVDGTDYNTQWADVASSGGGTLYLARLEYTSTSAVGGVEFIPQAGFTTSGANVGTISNDNVDLTFNETTPPKEIIVYAYQANNSRYVITQLDGGGNNASFYAQGATEVAHASSFGIGNQVNTDLFTNFSAAKLTLDLSMNNTDAVREPGGFGAATKEAHAFIVFRF